MTARAGGAALFAVLAIVVVAGARRGPSPAARELPAVMVWAWERPEDLRFLDAERVGVAYLAGTVTLAGDRAVPLPRRNELVTPTAARRLPVVRVEVDRRVPPSLDDALAAAAAAAIARLAAGPAVQVDFDAAVSQRSFQRRLLVELRLALPSPSFLSATALASTCFDGGAAALPVDEVVPMLFRLGPEAAPLRRRVARSGLPDVCVDAVGLATDEPAVAVPPGARLYLFAPRRWDATLLAAALSDVPR